MNASNAFHWRRGPADLTLAIRAILASLSTE